MPANRLKQILDLSRSSWDRDGTRPAVRENFAKVLDCGTGALGYEVYASANEEKYWYHRCKSRFCPSCGYRATLLWLEQQEADIPEIPYTGLVFTMPRELWSIFRDNRHLLHDLPTLGAAVIQSWIRMKYGLRVLVIVVQHTFGGDLKFYPHLHVLVSAGGLSELEGRWIPRIKLNKYALMKMWRYIVISHLRRALKSGLVDSESSAIELSRTLTNAYEEHPTWIVFLDRIVSKSHFLRYSARYVRRPPIASWRLLKVIGKEVIFVAKDTRRKALVSTQAQIVDFVRVISQHVPDKYKHSIRYFGLLTPRAKGKIKDGIWITIGQQRRPRPPRLRCRDSLMKAFAFDPLIDSQGQEMEWVRRGHAMK